MPFKKITSEKLSSAVSHQIEQLILRGILRPGERLPAERELAERLGVSRPSLREALSDLTEAGLVVSKAGSGIYVADVLGNAFSPALVRLFRTHDEAVFDYVAFRRDVEGLAAERAARHASDTDLKVIQALFDKMVEAHEKKDGELEAQLDSDFHLSIIEASHNVVMLHMMRSMYDLLRDGVFYNRQQMILQHISRSNLLDQHRAMNDALQRRDSVGARAAVEAHLTYVQQALRDQKIAQENESIAQQRLEHARKR